MVECLGSTEPPRFRPKNPIFPTKTMFLLDILQLVTGILLIVTILLQSKGDGLGSAFGGGAGGVQTTRRGAEKTLFNATVVLAAVFIGLASARMFIS